MPIGIKAVSVPEYVEFLRANLPSGSLPDADVARTVLGVIVNCN